VFGGGPEIGGLACGRDVGRVAPGQRLGGQGVRDHAEQDRGDDGGQHRGAGLAGVELVVRDEGEHDRGESPGTEPPEERHGGSAQAGADQRDRDRGPATHGQRQHREHRDGPRGAVEHQDRDGTEDEPHDDGQQLACLGREPEDILRGLPGRAEGHATDERGDEAVAAGLHRGGVGQEGASEDGDGLGARGRPRVATCETQPGPAGEADADTDEQSQRQVHQRRPG
jgi:hypothetical protein